ncbi:hypothetical protein WN944_014222 [Citrus x changshan-huyou]|uniref:Uncharacterized protein n=1 Tax=Citrus x changshan-huyou TaxID=2935761 RepID=A0AAP0MBS0_9ROSI
MNKRKGNFRIPPLRFALATLRENQLPWHLVPSSMHLQVLVSLKPMVVDLTYISVCTNKVLGDEDTTSASGSIRWADNAWRSVGEAQKTLQMQTLSD